MTEPANTITAAPSDADASASPPAEEAAPQATPVDLSYAGVSRAVAAEG